MANGFQGESLVGGKLRPPSCGSPFVMSGPPGLLPLPWVFLILSLSFVWFLFSYVVSSGLPFFFPRVTRTFPAPVPGVSSGSEEMHL